MKNIFTVLGFCVCLTACGFQPMYGNAFQSDASRDLQTELMQIDIANIPDREGQFLRNALIDRFYRDNRPVDARYILTLDPVSESIQNLDITRTSDATRAQISLKTKLNLLDKQTNTVVLKQDLVSTSSYNILKSEFANRVSEQNTRENALNDLARQAELHIGLYLQKDN